MRRKENINNAHNIRNFQVQNVKYFKVYLNDINVATLGCLTGVDKNKLLQNVLNERSMTVRKSST